MFVNTLSMDLLHRRLGHSGEVALHRLLREDMATGLNTLKGKISPCDSCQLGKLTRPPHLAVHFDYRTTRPLQLVVMDLAGPVKPNSLGGASYFLGLMNVRTSASSSCSTFDPTMEASSPHPTSSTRWMSSVYRCRQLHLAHLNPTPSPRGSTEQSKTRQGRS